MWFLSTYLSVLKGFLDSSVVQDPPANIGDTGARGLIPVSVRPLEEEMANHSSILVWKFPWTEEPGGSMGLQRVRHS